MTFVRRPKPPLETKITERSQAMPQTEWTWSSEINLPSDRGVGREVVDTLLSQLQQHKWIDHDVFGVNMAMEEALVNAIKHGNKENPEKLVHIVCKMNSNLVRIEITDEGAGFTPEDVPDPTDDENLEIPSGRGLMLMRTFMSLVEYNDKGNHVVMEKRRTDPAETEDDDVYAD